MKKITSIVLSVSMAAGALGMNTAVVHAEESAKKVAYISAANQFDFFVYIGAEIKKVGEENGHRAGLVAGGGRLLLRDDRQRRTALPLGWQGGLGGGCGAGRELAAGRRP